MPSATCVVDFCLSKKGSEASLHRFPRDAAQRQAWVDFVRATGRHYWTPGKSSVICSLHFDLSSYQLNPAYLASFDIPAKRYLRHGAVPTLYPAAALRLLAAEGEPTAPKRQCVADANGLADCSDTASIVTVSMDETLECPTLEGSSSNTALWFDCPAASPSFTVPQQTSPDKCDVQTQCTVQVALKSTQAAFVPKTRSIGVQTGYSTKAAECQTELTVADIVLHEEMGPRSSSPQRADLSLTFHDNPGDTSYQPSLDSSAASASEPPAPRKYIVYEDHLLQLTALCRKCHHRAKSSLKVIGSLVIVTTTCPNMHTTKWFSQPTKKRIAHGNVLLAASILFTGCSPTQVLRLLDNAGICCFSKRTYDRIQKSILIPAVHKLWDEERLSSLSHLRMTGAKLAGDSRADSPGYSAKYGTYSLLDTSINRVIDLQLVQSNEVRCSGAMELEGLKRALDRLDDSGVQVFELVTDRHTQVRAYMRKERPGVTHLVDAWHVAKGLQKKLLAASKCKGCAIIELWMTSIVNHLYFAVKTGSGDGDLTIAIWKSILNHVQDKHSGHSKAYAVCQHGDLLPRKWIYSGTDAYAKLTAVIDNKRFLNDIRQISPSFQTSSVESFHSVINRFAPKSFRFSYHGMFARSALAALHYNENADRAQHRTATGTLRWQKKHPKANKGKPVVCPIKEPPTYSYVTKLLSIADDLMESGSYGSAQASMLQSPPPPLSSYFEPVDKAELVRAHTSRFALRRDGSSGVASTSRHSQQ